MTASHPTSRTLTARLRRAGLRALLAAASAAAVGCQSQTAHVAHPLTADLSGNAPEMQMEFWHTLADRHVTSNDEAFHGLLLYLDNEDAAPDYAGRVDALKQRKMLPADFHQRSDDAVERGTLAFAIVRALQIKGGWVLHVLGNSPRYATKELMYQDLYPPSSPNQTFSGAEFLGIIGKMEDHQRETAAGHAPTEAPQTTQTPTSAPAPNAPAAGPRT